MSPVVRWLIYFVVAAAVIFFTTRMWKRSDAKRELYRQSSAYSRELCVYAITHGYSKSGVDSHRGNYTVYYYRTIKGNVVYELAAYVYGPVDRKLELRRYELPKGEYSDAQVILAGLFWSDTYGGLEVVSDERFSDDWQKGELNAHRRYFRKDGKPFDRRARDIGVDAGVSCDSWKGTDNTDLQKRFLEVMKETLAAMENDRK